MSNPSNIERVVMRRVHAIHVLRPIVSAGAFAALVAILALWGIGREVWVAKVFANAPHDFVGESRYLVYAFDHTRLVVQALTIVTLASLVYLAREAARLLVATITFAHA